MAHILLAEDHEPTANLTRLILSRWGHTVAVARTGQEAIELVAVNKFDLALVDIQLPVIDGYALTKQLSPSISVVGFTAFAEQHVTDRLLELGAKEVIIKPFDAVHLKGIVERCLDNSLC